MEFTEHKEANIIDPKTDFARRFLQNRLTESALVYEGHKTRIYRIFEQNVNIQGLADAKFIVDFCEPIEPENSRPKQLRFEYIEPKGEIGENKPIAEMHFDILDSNHLVLVHRYVKPELRGSKGLGTQLFKESEQWLEQVSQTLKNAVEVGLQSGQQSVIRWALGLGFNIDEGQVDIYNEVREHPERFIEDEVILSKESQENKLVKAPYTFRTGTEGRYMEDAIRIKLLKKIDSIE